ncbi:MAG: hypothetical protein ACKVH9_09490, partial [Rhodobacterales bacterium]
MNKNIVERLNIYKKFFKILIDYARLNISFSITYVSLLMLDSFAKIFSVISMAPLVEFLSGDNVGTQQITLFFKDVYFNPLHTSELCKKIETVIRKKITGTFNLG